MDRALAIRTPLPPAKAPPTAATPPPAYSSRGERVLGEQAYTSAVSALVEHHYFPDLHRLAAENAYLDAVATGHPDAIQLAAQRLVRAEEESGRIPPTPQRRRGTPRGTSETPRAASATPRSPFQRGWATPSIASPAPETPLSQDGLDIEEPEEPLGDEQTTPLSSDELNQLTLDQFARRYTSADNASFTELMDRANQERRHKYAWAFVEEHRQKRKFLAAREDEQGRAEKGRRLALPANEAPRMIESGIGSSSSADADATSQQLVPVTSSSEPTTSVAGASFQSDTERTTPASWSYEARNNLMFAPPGLPVKPKQLSGPGPSIAKHNTRLPDPEVEQDDDELASGSVIGLTPISATPRSAFSDTPTRSEVSYPYLASPLPEPEEGTPSSSSRLQQLLDWSAQQTPAGDTTSGADPAATPTGFTLPPTSRREELAHRLASRSSATPTTSKVRLPHRSLTPRTPRQALSPAGRSLLQRATDRTASPLARSLLGSRATPSSRVSGGGRSTTADRRWTPVTKRS